MKSTVGKNKFGLDRHIPAPTMRAVRRECGFGCVVCGDAICQYHHFDPEWNDARDHLVSRIALLCGSCHDKVTKGLWSQDYIRECRMNPKCKQGINPFGQFDFVNGGLAITFGRCQFIEPKTVIRIFNEDLLAIHEPEDTGGPPRLSGYFFDQNEKLCFSIDRNIFQIRQPLWDAEWKGSECTIRRGARDIALRFHIRSRNEVAIDTLKMCFRGVRILANKAGIWIGEERGKGISFNGQIFRPECCVEVQERRC